MTNLFTTDDIVISSIGMLTAQGVSLTDNLKAFTQNEKTGSAANGTSTKSDMSHYKMSQFNPAPYLTDRKVVKVVSKRDVYGLVALETCFKNSGLVANQLNPERLGLYVGAPPSSCLDHHNYHEAMIAGGTEKAFGDTFKMSSPTTLLTGLPNNVLCYGAKTLDARGPNSNYTCMETSSHMAVMGAVRSIKLGKIDQAVAGGYSAHTDAVFTVAKNHRGFSDCTPMAEGAVFVTIEKRSDLNRRGGSALCQILACDGATDALGPYQIAPQSQSLRHLIQSSIAKAGLAADQISVVMTSGSQVNAIDSGESNAINKIWLTGAKPIVATTAKCWGNLMEAGGLADVGFLAQCFHNKIIPASATISQTPQQITDQTSPFAVILRSSTWGEYSCLVVKIEHPPTERNWP